MAGVQASILNYIIFLSRFFVSSSSGGEKQQYLKHPTTRACIAHYIHTLMYIGIRCIYCILCKVQSQLFPVLYFIITMHDNNNIILSRQLQRLGGTSDYHFFFFFNSSSLICIPFFPGDRLKLLIFYTFLEHNNITIKYNVYSIMLLHNILCLFDLADPSSNSVTRVCVCVG